MTKVAVYDTKPYDRQYLQGHAEVQWNFHEFRLSSESLRMLCCVSQSILE